MYNVDYLHALRNTIIVFASGCVSMNPIFTSLIVRNIHLDMNVADSSRNACLTKMPAPYDKHHSVSLM